MKNLFKMQTLKKTIVRLWIILFLIISSIIIFIASVNYNPYNLFGGMPSLQDLEKPESDLASELYSSDNLLLGKYFRYNRSPIEFNELSEELVTTLLVTEDIRFYDHSGIDFKGLVRASYGLSKNILTFGNSGIEGGGSTITQQLAKNLFHQQARSKTNRIIQKFKEWILAIQIEKRYTKDEIILMYFNTVPYGNSYGIKSAAKTYFNKNTQDLKIEEAAVLVGMLKANTTYNPIRNPKNSQRRRNIVLSQMLKNDYLDQNQYDSLKNLPLIISFTFINSEK